MKSDVLGKLPVLSGRRAAVRVSQPAMRHIRAGHPWVYDESITSVSEGAVSGDLAVVFDDNRKFAAIGLYDPASPIRLKMLHHGRPVTIDAAWWRARIIDALDFRAPLHDSGDTTGYRCINGENDGFPGLILDRYADTYVLKLYSAIWFPHLATILPILEELLEPAAVVLRLSRRIGGAKAALAEGTALVGDRPTERVSFLEYGLKFEADVIGGQKTGYFLDQRENRAMIGRRAAGARVLDVFSASGGFSVHAAAGGATSVHSVDMSPASIALARHHMALNADVPAVKACRHETTTGDAFRVMEELAKDRQRFDIVVIDPPSFAQRQDSVELAIKAYRKLTILGLALVAPEGTLFQASCSSRVTLDDFEDTVFTAARDHDVSLNQVVRTGHAPDHPISFPEGAYLKAITARVAPSDRRR